MLSANLWRMKSHKSGQVYHIGLPRKAYHSSKVGSSWYDQAMQIYVLSVKCGPTI